MYVPVKLDKMRNFRYGMKALALIEKALGQKITKINFEDLGTNETAIVIWAGLAHEDPELTPEKVMDLIDEYASMGEVFAKMQEAMKLAFKPIDDKPPNAKKKVDGGEQKKDFDIQKLLLRAIEAEIKVSEFWAMTPAEVVACIISYNERYKAGVKEKITIAYITASLARAKKDASAQKTFRRG